MGAGLGISRIAIWTENAAEISAAREAIGHGLIKWVDAERGREIGLLTDARDRIGNRQMDSDKKVSFAIGSLGWRVEDTPRWSRRIGTRLGTHARLC